MLLTCSMPLSATLVGQFWIWLRGDTGVQFNRATEYTPLAVHERLHSSGGNNMLGAMLRGHLLVASKNLPPPNSEVFKDCERLGIANRLTEIEDFDGEGSIVVWRRLSTAVDRYTRKVAVAMPGSDQALFALCELIYFIQTYHPFVGGNARVATMLLHRELSIHGFHPVLMFNTDAGWLGMGNSLADFVLLVREGLLAWEYAVAEQQQLHSDKGTEGAAVDAPPLLASPWVTNATLRAQHVSQFPNRWHCNAADRWATRSAINNGTRCPESTASDRGHGLMDQAFTTS